MLKMMHRILCTRYLGGGENGFPHALKILVLHFCLIYKIWYSDGLFSVKVSYLMWIFISFLSVKIWLANIEGLNRCTNAEEVPFALVAEVHNKHQFSTVQIWQEWFMRHFFLSAQHQFDVACLLCNEVIFSN